MASIIVELLMGFFMPPFLIIELRADGTSELPSCLNFRTDFVAHLANSGLIHTYLGLGTCRPLDGSWEFKIIWMATGSPMPSVEHFHTLEQQAHIPPIGAHA